MRGSPDSVYEYAWKDEKAVNSRFLTATVCLLFWKEKSAVYEALSRLHVRRTSGAFSGYE